MTGRTANRGYHYPECEPPLVKDRSDIGFLRDLAQEVNADAEALDDSIESLIERPPAARIALGGNITITKSSVGDAIFLIPYNSTTYANPASFAELGSNGLRIPERGFYMFTSYLRCTTGGDGNWQLRHTRDGFTHTEGRRFEGPAYPVTSGLDSSMETTDFFPCDAGDLIQTQAKGSPADGTYAFECRLSAILVLPLDV